VEDETAYEEAPLSEPPSPSPKPTAAAKSSTQSPVSKSKYVSDAQRARIASEPVALLRAKIAKQYGMMAKKN
jgi:hypothetical protein